MTDHRLNELAIRNHANGLSEAEGRELIGAVRALRDERDRLLWDNKRLRPGALIDANGIGVLPGQSMYRRLDKGFVQQSESWACGINTCGMFYIVNFREPVGPPATKYPCDCYATRESAENAKEPV